MRDGRKTQGSILIFSYLLIAILITLGSAQFGRSATELNVSERYTDTLQAFHLSEAGVNAGFDWLKDQGVPPAGIAPFDPFGGTQAFPGGTYQITIDPDDNNPAGFLDLFTLTATGQATGLAVGRQITLLLRTESFSRFSYFTNSERLASGNPIWFTGSDHLAGPVHSNDQFNISGSPIFDGLVSSTSGSINYKNPPPAGGNNPQFNGGLELNAAPITLPLSATKLRVAAASAQGKWFAGNTTIVLEAGGTMRVTNPAAGLVDVPMALPANGAVFVNGGNVTVSGTLNGQVTIGTSDDVLINGHVRCAVDPQVNPASDDMLGLIAESDIIIAQTAPNNLKLQASVMALSTSFTVENWWAGAPRGTLNLYGGLIQDRRGPVGTFNSSTGLPVSGYVKNYLYDTRLTATAPPFYPTTGTYETLMWRDGN